MRMANVPPLRHPSEQSPLATGRFRRMFAAIDAGDLAALPDFDAAACVYWRPGFDPVRGIDALMHFYTDVRPIAEGLHRLDAVVEANSHAAVHGRFAGTLRNGASVEVMSASGPTAISTAMTTPAPRPTNSACGERHACQQAGIPAVMGTSSRSMKQTALALTSGPNARHANLADNKYLQ